MVKPIILTHTELVVPLNQAKDRLERIRERKMQHTDDIILEGLFVLAIASFENSLNDTIRILLRRMPNKLSQKLSGISKDDVLAGTVVERAVELTVRSISYNNVFDILESFQQYTGVEKNIISAQLCNQLQEAKATRNVLIHNNLVVNSDYIDTAGPLSRLSHIGSTLLITQDYLFDTIVTLRTIIQTLLDRLTVKYQNYTKVNAIKNLFQFVLPTPIMNFETEFQIDEATDTVVRYNREGSMRGGLSTGEEFIFNIWLSHFEGFPLRDFGVNFYSLSNDTRERVSFLMNEVELIKGTQERFTAIPAQ